MKTQDLLLLSTLLLASVGSARADVRYVDVNSTNATMPYLSWANAATNIQDAVDAAVAGDEIVVTNGIYATGGRDGNRVVMDKPLSLRSINGPQLTTITGGGRCVYLTKSATLSGFTLTGGGVEYSGGAGVFCESRTAVVSNCVISHNTTFYTSSFVHVYGGGVVGGTLNNCTLSDNAIRNGGCDFCDGVGIGGGAYRSTLNNCTLVGNWVNGAVGGAYQCTLNNCTLTGNSGSGASSSTLNNCTLTGNGTGASYSTLNNCIAYFNTGANYDSSSTLNYCCTTPLPTNGVGNISSDPQLASASHLSFLSPCIGKGSPDAASGVDIDGELWANPPSIGCDEIHAGATTGLLTVGITASFMTVTVGYPVAFTGLIVGRTDLSLWSFGDAAVEINQPYATHSWSALGDYVVSLWAFNDSYPDGVGATVTIHVVTGVHYVAADSANPSTPYASWASAATNIQDAINLVEPGGSVLVTNGIYAPIRAYGALSVRSVNGAVFTIIDGAHWNVCAILGGVPLSGFTLTNGAVGASGGTLNNCILVSNSAGGASGSTLNNCTLTGNSAGYGGGAYGCTLNNCILFGNTNNIPIAHCEDCGSPGILVVGNNWIGDAFFLDRASGNLRLQSNSPCINAGLNAFAPAGPDLDGNPRIVGGTVDIGAYEYQSLDLINFGVVSNQFGFNVTGQSNWVIVLEASSDFTTWTLLTTNTLGGSPFLFRDPTAPNLPQRFYRARQALP